MMQYEDVIVNRHYENIKNGKIYSIRGVGLHSENAEMLVAYNDEEGNLWFRPIGLFCLKFRKVSTS